MSTSEKQINANRRNAEKSTGPRSAAGKARVRLNAITHGILARETVIIGGDHPESEGDFDALLTTMRTDLAPLGYLEELLVQQITICYWRLRRAVRADTVEMGRAYHHIPKHWTPDYAPPGVPPSESPLPSQKSVDLVLRYEAAIQRELYRALTHLERLQRRRDTAQPAPTPKP